MSLSVTPQAVPQAAAQPATAAVEGLKPEAVATEPAKTEPDPLASKFSALAKQQKMLRQQQREIEAQKAEIAAQKAEADKIKAWRDKFGTNPWEALIEAGFTPEQASEVMLNQPSTQDVHLTQIQKKLRDLEAKQEEAAQSAQKTQQQQYEQAKRQITQDVTLLVDGDQRFEAIKAMSAQEAVTELIEQVFNEKGYIMPLEEAAKEVEDYLAEEALKLASLTKVKQRLAPEPPKEEAHKQTQLTKQATINTLTNRQTVQVSKPLSAKDRRERAIAAYLGQLN